MKISTRARYSIRLMTYLADNLGTETPINLSQIAENQGLSMRYLEQLVVPLKNASLLKSVSGKHGGYLLARAPGDISIGEIVEAAIGPIKLLDCLDPEEMFHPELHDRAFPVVRGRVERYGIEAPDCGHKAQIDSRGVDHAQREQRVVGGGKDQRIVLGLRDGRRSPGRRRRL